MSHEKHEKREKVRMGFSSRRQPEYGEASG